jgi:hypothetical protein
LRVDSIDELLEAIAESKFKYAHIATHGVVNDDNDKFSGWWTPSGIGGRKKVAEFDGRFKQTAIISTACHSGATSFGRYVVNQLGSRYYIGPKRSPSFSDSIVFAHLFYHKLFNTKYSVSKAFKSYFRNYKNPHGFELFTR